MQIKNIVHYLCLYLLSFNIYALAPHNLLIQKFEAIHSIDARFNQTVFMNGRKTASSSGHFVVSRPGKLRWDIERPHKQIYIANGQTIWIYEPELNQVTKKAQAKGIGGTAGLFLSNQPSLWIQKYKVTLPRGGDNAVFELRAKTSHTPFSRVLLTFNHDKLVGLEFWDQMGQNSQVQLIQVKMNQNVSSQFFNFSPPKHTDIINL